MITLLCPTKGRPDKMKRMWDSARRTAMNPELVSLYLGVNEEESETYRPYIGENTVMYGVKDWTTVFSLNLLADEAMKTKSNLFMVVGDDAIFSTPGWDKGLIDHYNALECKVHVYCLMDSRSEQGTPHPIVTRSYIDGMGYLATPIFMHWFVDTWMVDIAKANGCFTHMRDYLLIHDKPSDNKLWDLTHKVIRDRGWSDRDKYVNNKCQHVLEMERARLSNYILWYKGLKEHLD